MKAIKNSLRALREEDHRRALYAALVFIMLMILFFLLVSLEEPDPPLEEEVIEVFMPEIEVEMGSTPEGGSQSSDTSPEVTNSSNPQPELESDPNDLQDESNVQVTDADGTVDNNNDSQQEPDVDNAFTFESGNGDGEGDGQGDQFGSGDGVGGNGSGNTPGDGTYNPNRKVTKHPVFDANAQEEGKIALDIWVDNTGKVIKTRLKESKSTSGSAYLIKLAKKAAATMRYDKKPGAGIEHVGYKVFTFRKA